MNKIIEEYIASRKDALLKKKEKETQKLLNRLNLGEVEFFNKFPNESVDRFPLRDENYHAFRRNIGEAADEEIEDLFKYAPEEEVVEKKISGWYYFGIVMIVIGIIAGFVLMGWDEETLVAGIATIIGILPLSAIIILLAKIEKNTRQ